MIKITKIKKGIAVGTEIPDRQQYGNVGQWAENQLIENGYEINVGVGPDLAKFGVEVKTRKIESVSPHTVGSMTIQDIICTPYEQSNICNKFQTQYRVHYSDEGQVVTKEQIYDLTDECIQSKIREAYEIGRETITRNEKIGYHPSYVKATSWGNFEIVESGQGYSFRIPHGAMKKIETISENTKVFHNLFE